MIRITWQGHYLDGKTAARQEVEIQLLNEGLGITTSGGRRFLWPYAEIRQTQGFYGDEPVQLERGGDIAEILVIADHDFLTSLHQFTPAQAGRFHDPARRSLRLRLTVYAAAAIVAAGIFLYMWGIPLLAKIITPHVPIAWEKGLGESALAVLAPEEKRCQDPQLQKALDDMVARLNTGEPGYYPFKVYIVRSPVFNAVALPGGNMVVFSGLLEETASPEELAGVLAHEMQHIRNRHVTRRIIEDSTTGLIISAVSMDVTGAMLYGAKAAQNLAMLSYSRHDEEEADAEGIKMMQKAGLDPEAMIRFFEVMRGKEKNVKMPKYLQYLSTHPDLNERIERLRALSARSGTAKTGFRNISLHEGWDVLKKKCSLSGKPDDDGAKSLTRLSGFGGKNSKKAFKIKGSI